MKEKVYGPGKYVVEITIRLETYVSKGEHIKESSIIGDCRSFGELIDWEVK